MGLFVNTNMSSILGQGVVDRNNKSLTNTMQKLSTGLRINSSKDDAAGMAVAEALNSQIRGNDMSIRNANDAISMAQTAEAALTQIIGNMQRIRDVAVQSSSDALQDTDRSKLQTEVDQLTQEISRIIETTEFNGNYLLKSDPSAPAAAATFTFQVGHSGSSNYQIAFNSSRMETLLDNANIAGALPTTSPHSMYSADLAATGLIVVGNNAFGQGDSFEAIGAIDAYIDIAVNERTRFGAVQTRFETAINNVKAYNENLTASRSRIMDADFALESANLTRSQILQQAGTAMLAQANTVPQSALSLLR